MEYAHLVPGALHGPRRSSCHLWAHDTQIYGPTRTDIVTDEPESIQVRTWVDQTLVVRIFKLLKSRELWSNRKRSQNGNFKLRTRRGPLTKLWLKIDQTYPNSASSSSPSAALSLYSQRTFLALQAAAPR